MSKDRQITYNSHDYGQMNVIIDVSAYQNSNELQMYINRVADSTIWSYGSMTIELDSELPEYCAYLDTGRFSDIEEFVVDNGIGVFTGLVREAGEDKIQYPLYAFNEDVLEQLSPKGIEEYRKVIGKDEKVKNRLFIDMDGTLAEFKNVEAIEELYEPGYFLNLNPIVPVLEGVKMFIRENPAVDVYILSSVLADSSTAMQEKRQWLDRYLPEISKDRRIFLPCGRDKREYVPNGITKNDYLLDDYTLNLKSWEPPAKGIKVLNGINHTKGTWKNAMISAQNTPEQFSAILKDIVVKGQVLRKTNENKKTVRI